jgi:ribonuclease BN (tRNA processing enzyme)
VELTVLGVGGGWAKPNHAASGYLVSHDGFRVWVDQGNGTMANLQHHVSLDQVHAVVISHRHFDHFLDLYPFFLARWWRQQTPPIPLFAPPGLFQHVLQLEADLPRGFALHEVQPGATFHAGPLTVRTAPMRHPVPTLGMRFQADGQALVYSADTGPTDELVKLAQGAGVLLAEATWIEMPSWAEPIHMTAAQAGEAGRDAGVGQLMLTHIWPENPMDVVQQQASEAFGGPVTLAVEGMKVTP